MADLDVIGHESDRPAPDREVKALGDQIVSLLEEQHLYREPLLTVSDLAQTLDVPSKSISSAINQTLGQNFNELVNQYRIEAMIRKLKAGAHHQFTLLSLALECGFNSKTTFNRAFKKKTGLPPKQYIANLEDGKK